MSDGVGASAGGTRANDERPTSSRRDFLAAVGATTVGGALFGNGRAALAPTFTASGRYGAMPNDDSFLFEEGLIYLNTAALGPTPQVVIDRALNAWKELESNPSEQGYGRLEHALDSVRANAARFLGCDTDELILTTSTTAGMNTIAQGMRFAAGDHVLTTDQEHPGGVSCWNYLVRREGLVLQPIAIPLGDFDTAKIVERFAAAWTPRTRAISVSHILTTTGLRMPVAELAALARRNGGLCLVDGAQAVGGVAVDVKALGCHAYATSGHKWLMGPKGTGLLYLATETKGIIDPIALEAGHAAYSASSGIASLPSIIGLGAALELAERTGIGEVERRAVTLRHALYDSLGSVPSVRVVSPPPGGPTAPFVSFAIPPEVDAGALRERLRTKHRIVVKVVPKNFFNGLRISTHVFNNQRDISALVTALRQEIAAR